MKEFKSPVKFIDCRKEADNELVLTDVYDLMHDIHDICLCIENEQKIIREEIAKLKLAVGIIG